VAIGELGQRIDIGHGADALFDLQLFGDVAADAGHAAVGERLAGQPPEPPLASDLHRGGLVAEDFACGEQLRQPFAVRTRFDQLEKRLAREVRRRSVQHLGEPVGDIDQPPGTIDRPQPVGGLRLMVVKQHTHGLLARPPLQLDPHHGAELAVLIEDRSGERGCVDHEERQQRPRLPAQQQPFRNRQPCAQGEDVKQGGGLGGAVHQQHPAKQRRADDRDRRRARRGRKPGGKRQARRPGQRAHHQDKVHPTPLAAEDRIILGQRQDRFRYQDPRGDHEGDGGRPGDEDSERRVRAMDDQEDCDRGQGRKHGQRRAKREAFQPPPEFVHFQPAIVGRARLHCCHPTIKAPLSGRRP
jgi:hypothetical protein